MFIMVDHMIDAVSIWDPVYRVREGCSGRKEGGPRSQRWRRDPPATEAVATAAAARFQSRPCGGCEERGGA